MLLVAVLSFSCHDDDDPIIPEKKTNRCSVLVYMIAENGLYSFVNGSVYVRGDVTEMLAGCKYIPDSCELLLYVDDLEKPRIYVMDNKTTATSMTAMTPAVEYQDDGNSASPEVLNQALRYMYTNHKARQYGLVLWSHGSGWIESDYQQTNTKSVKKTSFGIDNLKNSTTDDGPSMEISDLAKVLEQYDSLKFVFFDACFMQTIETLYALRNSTDYVIGSPAEIPAPGAPYDSIMSALFADPFNPDGVARKYYEYYKYYDEWYHGVLLSAVETRYLEEFVAATKEAIGDVDLRDGKYVGVLDYFVYDSWRRRALTSLPDFYDMKGLMMKNIPEDRYKVWLDAFEKLTTSRYCTDTWYSCYPWTNMPVDSAQYGGVSMYVPLQKYFDAEESFTSGYYETDWYKALYNQ